MKTKYSRRELERQYRNDDERLEIVCCWHQLYDDVEGATFDRYPCLPHPDNPDDRITPDFAVAFKNTEYRLIGEIARIPNHDGGFARQLAQPVVYSRVGAAVDVLFLIHHSYAEKNEVRALQEGLLTKDGEQVLVVSYVRDTMDGAQWWIFKRASRFRDVEFRDEFVGEWSLKRRMTDTLDGVHVPSRRWGRYKTQYPICNDAPSPIYMACLLWDRVFPNMIPAEEYEEAALAGRPPSFNIRASAIEVRDLARKHLGADRIRLSWIEGALSLLKDARRAEKRGDAWVIDYGQLRSPAEGIRDLHLKIIHRLAPEDFDGDDTRSSQEQPMLFTD